jgi:hypothetical protein
MSVVREENLVLHVIGLNNMKHGTIDSKFPLTSDGKPQN